MPERTPCRIIIDIPDTTNFDWGKARALWTSVSGFELEPSGFNSSPEYIWYKVNPYTNKPVHIGISARARLSYMPNIGGESPWNLVQHMADQINILAREVYRLKSAKEPITRAQRSILNNEIHDLRANYEILKEMYS